MPNFFQRIMLFTWI
uniref:Uncharacterized protein n=1 Tax=Arundo donax TaxID=35708 RepID=A0A0A9G2W5_ARUDO